MSYEELKDAAEDMYRLIDETWRVARKEKVLPSLRSGEGPRETDFALSVQVKAMQKQEGYLESEIVDGQNGKEERFVPTQKLNRVMALCYAVASINNMIRNENTTEGEVYDSFSMSRSKGEDTIMTDSLLKNPYVARKYSERMKSQRICDATGELLKIRREKSNQ